LEDDILGAATDGTIYHFTLLDGKASLLLKFLENLVRWDELEDQISMLHLEQRSNGDDHDMAGNGVQRDDGEAVDWPIQNIIIDPEFVPGAAGQRLRRDQYGVNGDLLEGFLGADAGTRLRCMLDREGSSSRAEESRYVGNQKEERWRKFVGLVEKVLGVGGTENERGAAVEKCVVWLGELMRPVL
jgi:hypothetical protein